MKKILSVLLISLLIITGCGKEETKEVEHINTDSVVIYFSATGNTSNIAHMIAEETNSDIIEIIPKEKYTEEDLKYSNDKCRANKEQKDDKARPEISNTIDIDNYNTVYLGYPIWWGTNPRIILTLLDNVDFKDKTVILFCTSGSTGIEQSFEDLKKYNSNINFKDAKRFNSSTSKEEIKEWLKNK